MAASMDALVFGRKSGPFCHLYGRSPKSHRAKYASCPSTGIATAGTVSITVVINDHNDDHDGCCSD